MWLTKKDKMVRVNLNREEKVALMMARDIICLKREINSEYYGFIKHILNGNYNRYSKMSNKKINYELETTQNLLSSSVFSIAEKLLEKQDGYFNNLFTFKK